jgi:tetratricopeptide (TPR) repeat protein
MDDFRRQAEAYFERGNQLDEQGQRETAIQAWQQALELDPEHSGAHFNLGIAYAEENDLPRAIDELRQVIRLNPFDVEARRVLAEIYVDAEKPDEAINQLRQALNIAPGDGEAAHLLAQIYFDLERWDEASAALEAGGMMEDDADLWFELGMVYEMHEHRADDAILAYRRALIAKPEHAGAVRALRRLKVPLEEESDDEAESK